MSTRLSFPIRQPLCSRWAGAATGWLLSLLLLGSVTACGNDGEASSENDAGDDSDAERNPTDGGDTGGPRDEAGADTADDDTTADDTADDVTDDDTSDDDAADDDTADDTMGDDTADDGPDDTADDDTSDDGQSDAGMTSTPDAGGPGEGTIIGAAGGLVVSDDGRLTLEFPAGALTTETEITVTAVEPPPPTFQELPVDVAYELLPHGLTMELPVRATLRTTSVREEEDGAARMGFVVAFNQGAANGYDALQGMSLQSTAGDEAILTGELQHFSRLIATQPLDVQDGVRAEVNWEARACVGDTSVFSVALVQEDSAWLSSSATPSWGAEAADPSQLTLQDVATSGLPFDSALVGETEQFQEEFGKFRCEEEGTFEFTVTVTLAFQYVVQPDPSNPFEVAAGSTINEETFTYEFPLAVSCEPCEVGADLPIGIVDLDGLTALEAIERVTQPPQRSFADLAEGTLVAITGAEGFVVFDLESGSIVFDRRDLGLSLFGVLGVSQRPSGASSPAALFQYGAGEFVSGITNYIPGTGFGFTGLLPSTVYDATPFLGLPAFNAFLFVQPSVGIVTVQYNADSEFPAFEVVDSQTVSLMDFIGELRSAVAQRPEGSLIAITAGAPGSLWFHDRQSTPAAEVEAVGDDPRKLRFVPPFFALTNYGSNTLTAGLWDGESEPVVTETVSDVGAGPVGLDIIRDGDGFRVLNTGFVDNTYTISDFDSAGNLVGQVTKDVDAECQNPGHGLLFFNAAGALRAVLTCYTSGNLYIGD